MLDPRRLEVLREVAFAGSRTAAAKSLGCTPQAVSHHLNVLEREAGVSLFERSGGSLQLTPAGQLLVRRAEAIAVELSRARDELANLSNRQRQPLIRLATYTTAFVPQLVDAFRYHSPEARLETRTNDPEESVEAIGRGDLEVAFLYEFPLRGLQLAPGVEHATVVREPMWVGMSSTHRFADAVRIKLADLAGDPWVMPPDGSILRDVLLRACRSVGFEPEVRHTVPVSTAASPLFGTGQAVSLVPPVQPVPTGTFTVRPLAEDLSRRVVVAWRPEALPQGLAAQVPGLARAAYLQLAKSTPEYHAWLHRTPGRLPRPAAPASTERA